MTFAHGLELLESIFAVDNVNVYWVLQALFGTFGRVLDGQR